MKIALTSGAPVHLSYCTNIHPGETWAEVRGNIETHVLAVKRRVCANAPFGVGLRLSNAAAQELVERDELLRFKEFLDRNGLYVFTINGFPYGPFHGQPVKERVYRPDWLEDERLAYSDRLAKILSLLLPRDPDSDLGDVTGSVRTVPGCFRPRAGDSKDALSAMAARLLQHLTILARIAESGGPTIGLALEPEPHCVFETTDELIRFFEQHLFADGAIARLADDLGTDRGRAADLLQKHIGMCLDTCHAAVEFESPDDIVSALRKSGVRVLKMQVTTGLRLTHPNAAALNAIERFSESTYLHQTVVRHGRELTRHLDLGDALATERRAHRTADNNDEWRVHFHVPIFHAQLANLHDGFENTHAFLLEILRRQARDPLTDHLEVETYTWDVLPPELRALPVDEAIARELEFALSALTGRV